MPVGLTQIDIEFGKSFFSTRGLKLSNRQLVVEEGDTQRHQFADDFVLTHTRLEDRLVLVLSLSNPLLVLQSIILASARFKRTGYFLRKEKSGGLILKAAQMGDFNLLFPKNTFKKWKRTVKQKKVLLI